MIWLPVSLVIVSICWLSLQLAKAEREVERYRHELIAANVTRRLLAENVSELMTANAKLTLDLDTMTNYILASQKQGKWVTAYPGIAELRMGRTH